MNRIELNSIRLNSVSLNCIGDRISKKTSIPNIPEGAEIFRASDGAFMASDGVFYVRKEIV